MIHSYFAHCCIQTTLTTSTVALHTSLRDSQQTLFRCLSVPVSWISDFIRIRFRRGIRRGILPFGMWPRESGGSVTTFRMNMLPNPAGRNYTLKNDLADSSKKFVANWQSPRRQINVKFTRWRRMWWTHNCTHSLTSVLEDGQCSASHRGHCTPRTETTMRGGPSEPAWTILRRDK